MTDAMEPAGEDVEQEAADELIGSERHHLLPVGIAAPVVLVAEGDPRLVEAKKAAVRDGDAMGLAREVSEYGLRSSKRWLGIDRPASLPGRGEMVEKGAAVGQR